jgi:hypothetical protein
LLAVIGCSNSATRVAPNPNFTYQKAREGGFVLGGVCSLLEDQRDPLSLSNEMAAALQHRLVKSRRDLKVTSWGDFRRAVGDSTALRCIVSFRDHGSLDSALVESVAAALDHEPQFLVMARIERDLVETEEGTVFHGKDEPVGALYISKRLAAVAFTVYDLATGDWVWGTAIDGIATSERELAMESFLGKVLGEIFGTRSDETYPEPPDFGTAVDQAFEVLVGQLPKEE